MFVSSQKNRALFSIYFSSLVGYDIINVTFVFFTIINGNVIMNIISTCYSSSWFFILIIIIINIVIIPNFI